ncbi:hypothetical protein COMA1_10202 [Candidatus Nitrospira nitrosa]|uniref:Uncharacterized protein n=1 Tax=Candidatus Nitrospira nitrosa TaxID=1742972 RepID=A0A0S4L4M5_9BACT|nr:hypothetical protein COMA1_10202 [Candidatus Nitrospira nitrosa]
MTSKIPTMAEESLMTLYATELR